MVDGKACWRDLLALAISAITLASGCSFAVMRNPPSNPTTAPTCIDSRVPPLLDALAGVATAATTYSGVTVVAESEDEDADTVIYTILLVGAALTTTFLASAHVGFGRASRCEAAVAAYRRRPVSPPPVEKIPDVPLVEAIAAKDPLAAQLTLQAHRAALRGQCAPAAAVGPRVKYLDPAYHEQVFLVDAAIARCR